MTGDTILGLLDADTILLAIVLFGVILAVAQLRTGKRRRRWQGARAGADRSQPSRPKGVPTPPQHDAASQLAVVMSATFSKRRLMSKSEARVFRAAETTIANLGLSWRVMAQVSLGEILSSDDARAFAAINSKRVDILLVNSGGEPMAALEYQGSGHHLGTAAARDAVKKEALRKAGVAYIEVLPDHELATHLRLEIGRVARQHAAPVAA